MYIRYKMPPINPTSRQYLRVTRKLGPRVTWEAVTGVQGTFCRRLLRHTLANGALFYPSQGGRCAEGWKAPVSNSSVVNHPFGEQGRTPLYVGFRSAWGPLKVTLRPPPPFVRGLLKWALRDIN